MSSQNIKKKGITMEIPILCTWHQDMLGWQTIFLNKKKSSFNKTDMAFKDTYAEINIEAIYWN